MEFLTEKQVAELIVEHEKKNEEWVEKIKQELLIRKELKKKVEEAKQRQAVLLQVLARYEEAEKMVKKEIELVAKMEDSESLKMLAVIKQHEDMLAEQKQLWEQYKEQYESLPSVKKIRVAEAELLRSKIELGLREQKLKDMKKMVQLRELVQKKQEQAQIIKLAELYGQYMRREKYCQELCDGNKKLTAQAQHLRQELQDRENAKQQKASIELEEASELMKAQQLPQVDMSHFIIHRDKGNDKLDTLSINSYMLEEEYMNNNGQSIPKLISSQNKGMDVDTQDSMHMDVDTQDTQGANSQESKRAESNDTPRRLDFKGVFDNGDKTQRTPSSAVRNDNEMQSHVQSNSPSQSRSQVDEHNGTYDQNMSSQESHRSDARKSASQKPPQREEDATMHVSFASNENAQNTGSTPYDRPMRTPAKLAKSTFQEKHPHFQQTPKQEQRYRQETPQQNQNRQASNRSSRDMQKQTQLQPKRSSQEMIQQQSSRHSSQESHQQQQMSREVYEQNQQPQTPRHPPPEMYRQNQQQQTPRHPSQEIDQQQQQVRQPPQDVYQQNQQQQTPQQQSRQPPQEMCQQTPRQQGTYLRNEHQPIQVSLRNPEQLDFSRLPSNKPRILSNEHVNYDLQAIQRKPQPTSRTPMETPTGKSVGPPKNELTPFAYQVPFATSPQASANVTPMFAELHPSSMLSTTMHSTDSDYVIPDNISAILGSEISESGGSVGLARRLYDTDSVTSDFDYDAMMKNVCSPKHKISPRAQQPQALENVSTQPPAINQNTQDSNTNSSDRAFTFDVFATQQTNTRRNLF